MPLLKEHENESLKKYDKPFTELHQWMDEPVKIMGKEHRQFRHDPRTTPIEAKKIFGDFADHACLDHIIMDYEETARLLIEKQKKTAKNTTRTLIALRIPNDFMKILMDYAHKHRGHNLSATILYFIRRGIITQNILQYSDMFIDEQKSLMMKVYGQTGKYTELTKKGVIVRDNYRCRKCGSTEELVEYEIVPEEFIESIVGYSHRITLCKNCLEKLRSSIPFRYRLEIFLEWFYGVTRN